ncbi:hypothetical protein UB31_33735 [Bradyrhizobium sp. LTSP849]|nr:hypothetical protein UB31_33735 [Bradyrhizobium sp. LTSP849]
MCAGLGLPGFADYLLTRDTWRKRIGFLAKALRLFGKTFFKGCGLLETASLYGAAPFHPGKGRERRWRSHHR